MFLLENVLFSELLIVFLGQNQVQWAESGKIWDWYSIMLLCNGSHSASNDHQLETNFINHWVIIKILMNNGRGNFRNSHLADTSKVTKHVSQSNDSDQWKIKPHPLINLFSDQLMESPQNRFYFYFSGFTLVTLIGIGNVFR